MNFFDCNVYTGLAMLRPVSPVKTVGNLLSAMDNVGVEKALVWHIAQHGQGPEPGTDC